MKRFNKFIIINFVIMSTIIYPRFFLQPTPIRHLQQTTIKFITYLQETYHSNGRIRLPQTLQNIDGSTTTYYSDGSQVTHTLNGNSIKLYSDGTIEENHPDQSMTQGYKHGQRITKYPDGSEEYHHPQDID